MATGPAQKAGNMSASLVFSSWEHFSVDSVSHISGRGREPHGMLGHLPTPTPTHADLLGTLGSWLEVHRHQLHSPGDAGQPGEWWPHTAVAGEP